MHTASVKKPVRTCQKNFFLNKGKEREKETYVTNDWNGDIFSLDGRIGGRNVREKGISGGLEFPSLLFITSGFARSDAFPFLTDIGILEEDGVAAARTAMGPQGGRGRGVHGGGAVRRPRRGGRVLAVVLGVDGVRWTIVVADIIGRVDTGATLLASRMLQQGGGRGRSAVWRGNGC